VYCIVWMWSKDIVCTVLCGCGLRTQCVLYCVDVPAAVARLETASTMTSFSSKVKAMQTFLVSEIQHLLSSLVVHIIYLVRMST